MADRGFARALGVTMAHLQHAADRATVWTLRKMRSGAGTPEPKGRIRKTLRAGARVLGAFGTSYYEEYEKLKREGK